mgnify:CR=1 FL=1
MTKLKSNYNGGKTRKKNQFGHHNYRLSAELMETIVQVYDHAECAEDYAKAQEDITSPSSIDYDPKYDPVI